MSSPAPKPLVVFVAHALLLGALIGFWPTPRQAWTPLFHTRANLVFDAVDAGRLRMAPPPERPPDTRLTRLHGGRPLWHSQFDVDRIGWWPAAALLALLLATPMTALHRALAIVAGLALLDLFLFGRIAVEVAYLDLEIARGPGRPAAGLWHLLLRSGSASLTATIPSVAAVFVCWVALAQPRGRIALGRRSPNAPSSPEAAAPAPEPPSRP